MGTNHSNVRKVGQIPKIVKSPIHIIVIVQKSSVVPNQDLFMLINNYHPCVTIVNWSCTTWLVIFMNNSIKVYTFNMDTF